MSDLSIGTPDVENDPSESGVATQRRRWPLILVGTILGWVLHELYVAYQLAEMGLL